MIDARVLLVETSAYAPLTPLFAVGARLTRAFSFFDEKSNASRLSSPRARVRHRLRVEVPDRRQNRRLLSHAAAFGPDLVLVVKGNDITKDTINDLRSRGATVVNFSTDDPFNQESCSRTLREALPAYDLVCTPRRAVIGDLKAIGCQRIAYMPFGYNELVHFPEELPPEHQARGRFACDVAFVGGADHFRAAFFRDLLARLPNLSLKLYGSYWPRYRDLAKYHQGTIRGADFRYACSSASVSLNLVRRSNRDGHVMRSFELPAVRAFVIAERTEEHMELFGDKQHLLLFDGVNECADAITCALRSPSLRERVAEAGHHFVKSNGNSYGDRLTQIAELALANR
jgi:spore maturation protein CgeB